MKTRQHNLMGAIFFMDADTYERRYSFSTASVIGQISCQSEKALPGDAYGERPD